MTGGLVRVGWYIYSQSLHGAGRGLIGEASSRVAGRMIGRIFG